MAKTDLEPTPTVPIELKSTPTVPIELNIEANAYRETLLDRADAKSGGAPLWHGWAIFDAYVAGVMAERSRVIRGIIAKDTSHGKD